ncbi:hypothetical protein BAUCODRAFT_34503 [Baudoinia panamericana UAMH 10762]|uniref:Sugar phosphate transporter domain-containing protein n=1 Tax=Baudoinia panamericana (strain UAMH 10762) TaxID=717646 RepID=M2LN16_BAUPA|nr:uncharacterized protein BAUCODRAFT_34503 [Baudoinia panamericana UAMH 10762]EMC95732.1 hypothetical protein BAUCODRAFT_34503 [Baudoinia panamericana UAMH 10762]
MEEADAPTHRRRSGSVAHILRTHEVKTGQRNGPYAKTIREAPSGGVESDVDMDELESFNDDAAGPEDDEVTGLTHMHRKHKRRRRRGHDTLDGPSSDNQNAAEQRLATAALMRDMMINGFLIALWYTFSISISVYNKWMFSKENLDFHFPLFTTAIHMLVQFSLASSVLYIFPQFRPRPAAMPFTEDAESDGAPPPTKRPLMTRTFYLTRIAPCGTATALDIGLGNFSLRFITLSFYTMCKSSVLAFVLLFAFLFRLETPTWRLCAIIAVMTAGVIMMVAGEAAFSIAGFLLVMSASCCSGFRWSLTQILLLRNSATGNPFSSIFFLTPVMFVALFILALPIEGPFKVIAGFQALGAEKGWSYSTILLLFPGFLAFMMVAAEFALLKRTSVVTLSVCGIFKEVLTISAAAFAFGDALSPVNLSGLCVTIASIAAYNYFKYSAMARDAKQEAHEMLKDDIEVAPFRGATELDDDTAQYEEATQQGEPNKTLALMRDSLSLTTDTDGLLSKHLGNGTVASGHVPGTPVKRPHDVE